MPGSNWLRYFVKTRNHIKYLSYKKILYRFLVGLLLFILIFLLVVIVINGLSDSFIRTEGFKPVSLQINEVETVSLNHGAPFAAARLASCSFWNCVNIYRCGRRGHDKITIYIYPLKKYLQEDGSPISQFSKEFFIILDTVKHSKYYTPYPEEACFFMPSIDTLSQHAFSSEHVSQALYSLDFWKNGENHIIFNMLPGSEPKFNTVLDLNTSKAIIAGAGFDTWTFRYNFDISLPIYSELSTKINATQPKQKKYLIISTQTNIPSDYMSVLKNIASSSNDLLLLENCVSGNQFKKCEYVTGKEFLYPDVLKDSVYCLVIKGARLMQVSLLEVIASQCIPIIVADSLVMPFSSHVDWGRMALFIPESNLNGLLTIVNGVSKERRTEMFWQLRYIYDRYFSSLKTITLTALEILNERVFPLSGKSYEDWNLPEHLYGPVNPLFLPVTAPKALGFTAVILTYDRVESLFTLIRKLVKTPSLAKIIVVWNNQKKSPPPPSEWPVISKPLKVIRRWENKLSNRFYPYDEIETECQLTIDDDILMLTADELEFGFDAWREFPERLVGFPSRLHVWDNTSAAWRYHSEWTNDISMVLTAAAFHHKLWSYYYTYKMPAEIRQWVDDNFNCEDIAMNFLVANVTQKPPIKATFHHKLWSYYYTYKMPAEIRQWVDDNFNCEDIAMNFLVANVTQKPPIKVTPRKKFKCPECTNTEKLSADARHMAQRTYCINYFAKVYGHLPLQSVEFRADPLQFKETGAGVPLMYPDIGAL